MNQYNVKNRDTVGSDIMSMFNADVRTSIGSEWFVSIGQNTSATCTGSVKYYYARCLICTYIYIYILKTGVYFIWMSGGSWFCRPNGDQSDVPRTVMVRNDRLQKVQDIVDFHVAKGFDE